MKQPSAVLRVWVWGSLAAFAVYSGISLAAGPGRDHHRFQGVSWTASAVIQTLLIAAAFAFVFGRAARLTYRREVVPTAGVVTFPGGKMPVFGEVFMSLLGGLLLLVAVYVLLRAPEWLNAGRSPIGDVSSSMFFVLVGFVLLTAGRYVWEVVPGRGLVRYWTRAFAVGRSSQELRLYWMIAYRKSNHVMIPTEWWLRAKDPTSSGLFRDAFLETAPLDTPPADLDARIADWQQRLTQLTEGRVAIAVEPRPSDHLVAPAVHGSPRTLPS